MNRILAIGAAALFSLSLAGCGTNKTLVTEEKHIVVMPPEGLWDCPDVPEPPSGTYTQAEVADYILKLYQTHQICQDSIEEVRRYLVQAQKITEQVEK